MNETRIAVRAASVVAGVTLGAAAVLLGVAVTSAAVAGSSAAPERALRDVLHSPPLLVERSAAVPLAFDAVCQSDALGAPCALSGTVYVRPAGAQQYAALALRTRGDAALLASLPPGATAGDGFAYYAVVREGGGDSMTVPAGGAAAPFHAWVVPSATDVTLGVHRFGDTRRPDRALVHAPWGSGPGSLGLSTARNQATIGPSAFAVGSGGSLVVLDQVNRRLAFYTAAGGPKRTVDIPFGGGEGDVAVGDDGAIYVLDSRGRSSLVRMFRPDGTAAGVVPVVAGADMVRSGPGGAVVHGFPGDLWLPVGRIGVGLSPGAQAAAATPSRRVAGDREVVVRGGDAEASFALVRGNRVLAGWRVSSATPLGEVQLAEPFRDGLVAVVRVWTESSAEFVVLVLRPSGASTFTVGSVEWAESAALGRFRLAGDALYQLRSSRDGVDIVSFDLGGAS